MRQGLRHYLNENGFRASDYDAPRTPVKMFGLRFSVPNPPLHAWILRRHDLHHMATGFGTDLLGEAQLAVWEWRRGLRGAGLYSTLYVLGIAIPGLLLVPHKTWWIWRAAGRGRSLFRERSLSYEQLLDMQIGDLRAHLRVPISGLAREPRGLPRNPTGLPSR